MNRCHRARLVIPIQQELKDRVRASPFDVLGSFVQIARPRILTRAILAGRQMPTTSHVIRKPRKYCRSAGARRENATDATPVRDSANWFARSENIASRLPPDKTDKNILCKHTVLSLQEHDV
jgi:hypothetical protein